MQTRPLRGLKPADIPENWMESSMEVDDIFIIDVQTQAGTYVKEFVHGDFGRTKPSLCDLLEADVDIMALDVTGINLQWPWLKIVLNIVVMVVCQIKILFYKPEIKF